jgi:hypothetical protein
VWLEKGAVSSGFPGSGLVRHCIMFVNENAKKRGLLLHVHSHYLKTIT